MSLSDYICLESKRSLNDEGWNTSSKLPNESSSLCTVSNLVNWQCTKLLPFVGKWLGLVGEGCQKRAGECNWDTGGLICIPYCKGLYQRERSHPWGSTSVHNLVIAVVVSIGKYMIFLVPTGRIRVQLWVEDIFDCNCPCETSLRKWPLGNTKTCKQSPGQRLWYPLVANDQWALCL